MERNPRIGVLGAIGDEGQVLHEVTSYKQIRDIREQVAIDMTEFVINNKHNQSALIKEFIDYVVDAIEEVLLSDVVRRDQENRQNREKCAQDIVHSLIVQGIGESSNTQATWDQTFIDGVLMEYFDAKDKTTYGESLFSHQTIVNEVKRTSVKDELDSIDSRGSYTDKSTSMRRVCS